MWLSAEAARWALRFYRDHFWLVFGLSAVASVQRFISVRWGDELPGWTGPAGETVTAAARLLLIGLVVRLAFGPTGRPALDFVTTGARLHRRALLLQPLVLAAATLLFAVLPNIAIAVWAPETHRDQLTAIMLAVKNPTVIAFTVLWIAGVAVTLMAAGIRSSTARSTSG